MAEAATEAEKTLEALSVCPVLPRDAGGQVVLGKLLRGRDYWSEILMIMNWRPYNIARFTAISLAGQTCGYNGGVFYFS